jgi:two-component system, OmpR family, sensor histidine kinase SenX3
MSPLRRRANADEEWRVEKERILGLLAGEAGERRRLRTAFDALPVGVVLADPGGTPRLRNQAATFVGHEGVLVGEALERVLRQAASGAVDERRLEFFGPPRRVLALHAARLDSGDILATIDDISERARLDAVRTDFVANISHELKTPIGALSVLAEAMADSEEPEVVRRLAEKVIGEAHRVSRTIDDLMELARIELGGEAVYELVDIDAVLHDAVDRVGALAEQRGVSIALQPRPIGCKAMGDPRQLVSALANLLDNAVKYSERGSAVELGVVVHGEGAAGTIEMVVEDHGIGIPARDHDRIFERFYRVDRARSRETGGTGLGLAIVRHVATNHHGAVTVSSQEGVGSTFTLRIPACQRS